MWEVFKNWIFDIIQFFFGFCQDWGLAIIIVTIIFRVLISPLMHKQTKSSYQMQKVQPLMQEIQAKYANDPQRMQEEMQKLYADAKFNPLAGCLPMLLQMPIFIALFQVLREMPNYLGSDEVLPVLQSGSQPGYDAVRCGCWGLQHVPPVPYPYDRLRWCNVFAHDFDADGPEG